MISKIFQLRFSLFAAAEQFMNCPGNDSGRLSASPRGALLGPFLSRETKIGDDGQMIRGDQGP